MNMALKVALLRLGEPQFAVARRIGVSETRLSRIVQGRTLPSAEERRGLAELLRATPKELFPDFERVDTRAARRRNGKS